MTKRLSAWATLALVVATPFLLASFSSARADEVKKVEAIEAIRVTRREGKKTPQTLETAVQTFTSPDGTSSDRARRVDLVAAVHIGDQRYYEELNRRFSEYDAVLYELVADEGTKLDAEALRGRKDGSPLGSLQGTLSASLGLTYQLEHVNYTADNFVHADLPPDEFFRRFQDRGDLGKMLVRAFATGMTEESQKNDLALQGRLLASVLLRDKTLALKRAFADILVSQMTTGMWIIDGGDSAIITDRNAACLRVLRRELDAGKKKVAIFYGGAHLADLSKSLIKDFGLVFRSSEWIVAWDMTTAPPKQEPPRTP